MQELTPRVQTQMNKDGTFEPATLDNMFPFIEKNKLQKIRKNSYQFNNEKNINYRCIIRIRIIFI